MTLPQLQRLLKDMQAISRTLRAIPPAEVTRKIQEAALALASQLDCQSLNKPAN